MPTYLTPGVYVEEIQSGARPIEGVGTAVAAFVGLAESGPFHTPTLVTNWSQFTQIFGDFVDGFYLAHALYGYFTNGGGAAYVVRVGADGPAGNGQGDGARAGGRPAGRSAAKQPRQVTAGTPVGLGAFQVAALGDGVVGGDGAGGTEGAGGAGGPLSVEVADPDGENPPEDRFKLLVRRGDTVVETFDVSTRKNVRNYVITQVREHSTLITVTEGEAAGPVARPDKQRVTLTLPAPVALPDRIGPQEYVGDVDDRTGFGGLETIDEITMVAVPDLMSAYEQGAIDAEGVKAVQLGVIAHCELMGDRMAILDPPPDLTARQVRDWRQEGAGYDSKHATLYYPWVKVFDPSTGQHRFVPPSGHVAGVWARSDGERGVHKAPANEVLRGVIDLQNALTRGEQDLLNPIGVNCVRSFPGRGVRIWGARTLSSDPAWRYLNVRRLFNYLEESILVGTQWVVFEPNDERLWARIRRNIYGFLVNEWRAGALFGSTADEAFYVKCDHETNPTEVIDVGQVVCEIGVAPVKPAEFVIFRLAQFSGGTSLVSE